VVGVGFPEPVRGGLGEVAEALFVDAERLGGAAALGDVDHRALVEQRAALLVAHDPGILADPDALARLVAIDLGLEPGDAPVALQQRLERGATPGLDIPFAGDVVDRGQKLVLAVIAVQAHQRGIGAKLPAVRGRAVDALGRVVEHPPDLGGGEVEPRLGARQLADVDQRAEHGRRRAVVAVVQQGGGERGPEPRAVAPAALDREPVDMARAPELFHHGRAMGGDGVERPRGGTGGGARGGDEACRIVVA
jgi:hypothetical protein